MELRKAYVQELARLMRENDKIVILDADLAGAGGTKPLYSEFPDRCVDCGIAEANMACIAAGLSASGFIPFIHSFVPFGTRRVFDQIAVSISYSEQNVKIVGFDPGVTMTVNGGTHMCFEDMAALRALCNVAVLDIVDGVQLVKAPPFIVDYKGTVYLRFERKQTEELFDDKYVFRFGKADKLDDGKDLTIIASGTSVLDAKKSGGRFDRSRNKRRFACRSYRKTDRRRSDNRFGEKNGQSIDGGEPQHTRRIVRSRNGSSFRKITYFMRCRSGAR